MAKKENNYYYDTFSKCISYACEAAELLQNCIDNYQASDIKVELDKMHRIEHTADGVKHEMMEHLMKEFLPPIEREDIVELSHAIDDVIDAVEDVLRGMYMYNITEFRTEVKEFASVIFRSCKAMQEMGNELHNFRKSALLKEKIVEINALEEEADRLYIEAIRRLYIEEKDSVYILSWTTMYNCLEKCCDSCEEVADMVEQIVMKNS